MWYFAAMEGYQPVVLTPRQQALDSSGDAVEFPESLLGEDQCFQRCFWFLTGESCPLKPGALGSENREFLKNDGRFPIQFDAEDDRSLRSLVWLDTCSSGELLVRLYASAIRHMGHWIIVTPEGIFDPGYGRKNIPTSEWSLAWNTTYSIARIHRYSGT